MAPTIAMPTRSSGSDEPGPAGGAVAGATGAPLGTGGVVGARARGVGVGVDMGVGETLAVGPGAAVAMGVGVAVGRGVGFGVGGAVGGGVDGALTMIVPVMKGWMAQW